MTCVCHTNPPLDFPEIATGVRSCGWCHRVFDDLGSDVPRPSVEEPINLDHLDRLRLGVVRMEG